MVYHRKGERRIRLDLVRLNGEPRANFAKNRERGSKYGNVSKKAFHRKKGRDRFKTGKKSKRSRSTGL